MKGHRSLTLEEAFSLARRVLVFRVVDDHRRPHTYVGHVGDFTIELCKLSSRDFVVAGGFGFEHDAVYRIRILDGEIPICAHTYVERDFAGVGDGGVRLEEEVDPRIKEMYRRVSNEKDAVAGDDIQFRQSVAKARTML